ncbi:WecB/TagA/CpsF family glycosyltransferase [Methylobacterium sp. J-090]|uniref:WecB/TagA/CpsF family glycosyltransferase n=1 Tax=Methylobacterium sp. J-090 TaxID=2836666 RepID=UPI001FBB0B66|nr:WecB/TagA/CpsF family glycosyltransferase [Methylobacterium sp. J-090]MCJ2083860.1 WecB/TagA/CpsF family glycosyltransferase [Methylobacterium sp. J-090]
MPSSGSALHERSLTRASIPPTPGAPPRIDGQFINVANPAGAVAAVRERAAAGRGFTFFTLNLDHLVKLRDHPGFRAAYRSATLVSADGWPVARLARRSGGSGEAVRVTTGADLVAPLCAAAAADGVPVYLFGATEKSLAGAAAALRAASPDLDIRGWHAPPFGFDPLSPQADADADRIAASGARLVFVALGAPKQELFAARAAERHPSLGLVCIGAALDFLSGIQVRAPRRVRAARLEWLWRMAHAPKALGGRYARCAGLLARLTVAEPALRALGFRDVRTAEGAPDPSRARICLMYTMDPRGAKVGGIETHIRQILAHHPADVSVLFVGTDEAGDCTLGEVRSLVIEGRTIDFLPVAQIRAQDVNHAAKSLSQSITLHYVLGALRHVRAIRRAIGPGPATADLHRFEFAPLARLLGLPAFQMVHGEGSRGDRMDSLIKSYWYLHALGERLALRWATGIFCVNPAIVERIAREFPRALPKAEVLTVSVDTTLFSAQPFACADGVFRIVFAGRLDAFKDPALIFATLAALRARLGGQVELHYVGASDPTRFPEFAAVSDITVRHGFQDARGVARIMALCHAGILTSFFEGMPCFLLEGLASGRPFGAIRLPQFDGLIEAGTSGFLVERGADTEASAALLAEHFAGLWDAIRLGRLDPAAIHAKAAPYAVTVQMNRLFARHRAVQGRAALVDVPATLA